MRAKDMMTSAVRTVQPDTPVKQAAGLLVGEGFTALPVVDADGRLVGLVTEADLIRSRILPDPRTLLGSPPPHPRPDEAAGTVTAVMATNPVVVGPGTDVAAVSRLMLERHLRALPVVDGDRLVGILTRRDLLRTIARDDDAIARDVRRRVSVATGHSWSVAVRDGVVTLGAERAGPDDRHIAVVVAGALPGVREVRVDDPRGDGAGQSRARVRPDPAEQRPR